MTGPSGNPLPVWHDEGRRAASTLDAVGAVLVVGRDPDVAAWVALGMARAQAERRRVAVADLIGEAGPLQALVADDDPHGITDSFRYGVSLNKIARSADASGNLFVLPSGSETVAVEEIFRSDRWCRLAGGFREVGALLVVVAQADTPGLEALAEQVDGVVIAGDASGALPDAAPPLAVVAPTSRRGRGAVAVAVDDAATVAPDAPPRRTAEGTAEQTAESRPGAVARPRPPRPAGARAPAAARRDWRRIAAFIIAVLLVAGALLYWVPTRLGDATRDRAVPRDTSAAGARPTAGGTTTATSTGAVPAAADSAPRDASAPATAARSGALPRLVLANPADSTNAARWAVHIGSGNTPDIQALASGADPATLPVPALTPLPEGGRPWYRLLVGAFGTRGEAEQLLARLRQRGVLGAASGSVVRAPYALLVEDRVPAARVLARVQALVQQGVPVYPLPRGDGTVALYAGAFELRDDAAYLARDLQAAGVTPVLVYRTGRSP